MTNNHMVNATNHYTGSMRWRNFKHFLWVQMWMDDILLIYVRVISLLQTFRTGRSIWISGCFGSNDGSSVATSLWLSIPVSYESFTSPRFKLEMSVDYQSIQVEKKLTLFDTIRLQLWIAHKGLYRTLFQMAILSSIVGLPRWGTEVEVPRCWSNNRSSS